MRLAQEQPYRAGLRQWFAPKCVADEANALSHLGFLGPAGTFNAPMPAPERGTAGLNYRFFILKTINY